MNKFSIKTVLVFLFILLGVVIKPPECNAYNPEIFSYKIDIDVSEDRIYSVKEQIKVYYYSPMHIFERIIPLEGYTIRKNAKGESYNVKISDIKADREFTTYNDINNCLHIKIGDEDKFVNGSQSFLLSYTYKVSVDKMNNKDEFYFPLITAGWDAPIPEFTFNIKMPKTFDANKIYFYDKFKSANSVRYFVKDNHISGVYKTTIYPNDTLTIKINLPENYFKKTFAEKFMPVIDIINYIIPIVILLIVGIINILGQNKKSEKNYVTESPEGYNPLEISYIFHQKINYSDTSAMILLLANKGFIKIEDDKGLEDDDNFKLVKIKNYDGKNKHEKLLMDFLFSGGIDFISSKDLNKKSFYKISKTIMEDVKNKFKPIFEQKIFCIQNLIILLMILRWILMCIYIGIKIGFALYLILLISLPILSYAFLINGIIRFIKKQSKANIIIFIGCIMLILTTAVVADAILINNPQLTPPLLVALVSVILMDILRHRMSKFPLNANKLYLKVKNFREFIEKVESEKLQRFVNKDNEYYYKILPYAYIFGMSKNWLKKFEYINCPPPKYYNKESFYKEILDKIMNNIINVVAQNIVLSK